MVLTTDKDVGLRNISITGSIKQAMSEVWNFNPELMEELKRGDIDFTNHYLASEMNRSISLVYKYTISYTDIELFKSKITIPTKVFIMSNGFKLGCISPYLEVTVCYRL